METHVERRLQLLEGEMRRSQRECRLWRKAAVLVGLAALALSPKAGISQVVLTLEQRVAALESKLTYVTRSGRNMYVTGANLLIRNGANRTDSANGYGNLILGYGELRALNANGTNPNVRTGSHNLVAGWQPNYSSFGGIVSGYQNNMLGAWAGATAGYRNTVSGSFSCSMAGFENTVSGVHSTASGGRSAEASGAFSNTIGGDYCRASGEGSGTFGGEWNLAQGPYSTITGGSGSYTAGYASAISGGQGREARSNYGWAAGSIGGLVRGQFVSGN